MRIAASAYPLTFLTDFDAYAAKLTDWVDEAAAAGADLLVFPEYATMELASLGGPAVAADLELSLHEVARHRPAVDRLHLDLTARHGLHILGASGPVFLAERPVNRATLYGPAGIIGHQDKQMMTRFEREHWFVTAGEGLPVLDTPLGRIGILICYDSEFPLLARSLVERGAEILLVPSCTDSPAGFTRVRVGAMARALEGQCVVVHAATVGEAAWSPAVDENWGAAAIYGPPDRGFPSSGMLAETALNAPGWAYADLDLAAVQHVRSDGAVLNHRHWPEQADRLATR